MSNAWILVRRNLRVFWRDRGQVFFSLLAPLILLMLYVLFLGKMQVDNMTSGMKGASSSDIEGFVYAWVLAGMVMITTLTTSLSALSSFVDDRASGRFKEFRVSPVRDTEMVVGYMVAGLIISLTLSMVVLVVGSVAFGAMFGTWSTAMGYAKAVAYVALLCLTFSSLAALAVTFVRSNGQYSGLATMVGTLSGFLAFAYIPIGVVSAAVGSILNTLPFAQAAMLLRDPLAGEAMSRMLAPMSEPGRGEALDELRQMFGFDTYIGDLRLGSLAVIGILVAIIVICAAAASWRIRKLTTHDMR